VTGGRRVAGCGGGCPCPVALVSTVATITAKIAVIHRPVIGPPW
jgi:hypothetical protein